MYAYTPYLTLWDKISQTFAHLKGNSHKIFQISQNFQTILQHILWRNKHKSHFVVFVTSFLHLNKGFWLFWGSSKVIFIKISQNFINSPLKICLISQISVHSLWHVCVWVQPFKWKTEQCLLSHLRSWPTGWGFLQNSVKFYLKLNLNHGLLPHLAQAEVLDDKISQIKCQRNVKCQEYCCEYA